MNSSYNSNFYGFLTKTTEALSYAPLGAYKRDLRLLGQGSFPMHSHKECFPATAFLVLSHILGLITELQAA